MARCNQCGISSRQSPSGVALARLHDASIPLSGVLEGGYEVGAWSRPARVIGGDLVAAWTVGSSGLFVFLGDAMGHGTPAAVVASALRGALHLMRFAGICRPAEVLNRLNRLVGELFPEHFVTATACLFEDGQLVTAQAGHPPVFVRIDATVEAIGACALPLGLAGEDEYQEMTLGVPRGATFLAYSDGVVEALAGSWDRGQEILMALVSRRQRSAESLVRSIRRALLRENVRPADDCSVVAVRALEDPRM